MRGHLDLDEYVYAPGDGRLRDVNGRWLSFFPNATSVLITPVVFLIERWEGMRGLDLYAHLKTEPDWELVARLNQFIASIFAMLTVLVIYLMGRLRLSR